MEQAHWPTIGILGLCVVLCGLAGTGSLELFKAAAGEIVTFASLMAAGAMSAVVLVPTLMAHRFNDDAIKDAVREFTEYHGALWMGVFGVASFLAVLVILGQIVGWSVELRFHLGKAEVVFNLVRVLNAAIAFFFAYLIFRIVFLARAIQDLLRSVFVAAPADSEKRDIDAEEVELPDDPEYGLIVDYNKQS